MRPTGFEILPTPLRPRTPTPPPDANPSNYLHSNRALPSGHARVPNYNGDPADNDKMSDTSDNIPARSTTNIYDDDNMDDDDDHSNVVNASSVLSIYCPCPKQLCLSVRDQTLPTKAQKLPWRWSWRTKQQRQKGTSNSCTPKRSRHPLLSLRFLRQWWQHRHQFIYPKFLHS